MANATSGLLLGTPDLLNTRGAAAAASAPKYVLNAFSAPFYNPKQSLNGVYRIAGTTVDGGTPVKRKVYVFAQPGMVLVRSATTELPAATFEFTGLAAGQYTIVGFDPDGVQNAVTYSHVTSVV